MKKRKQLFSSRSKIHLTETFTFHIEIANLITFKERERQRERERERQRKRKRDTDRRTDKFTKGTQMSQTTTKVFKKTILKDNKISKYNNTYTHKKHESLKITIRFTTQHLRTALFTLKAKCTHINKKNLKFDMTVQVVDKGMIAIFSLTSINNKNMHCIHPPPLR